MCFSARQTDKHTFNRKIKNNKQFKVELDEQGHRIIQYKPFTNILVLICITSSDKLRFETEKKREGWEKHPSDMLCGVGLQSLSTRGHSCNFPVGKALSKGTYTTNPQFYCYIVLIMTQKQVHIINKQGIMFVLCFWKKQICLSVSVLKYVCIGQPKKNWIHLKIKCVSKASQCQQHLHA